MVYEETKVYSDGSHYIAIPKTTRSTKRHKKMSKDDIKLKEKADKVFEENKNKKKVEKKEKLIRELTEYFEDENNAKRYADEYMEKRQRNLFERRKRLSRKINIGRWNFFCTFTYDDKLHNEESFRKKLSNCLKKMSHRKGWVYIGVWERSPEKNRLHFHGLFNIPEGAMVGELIEVNDYSFSTHQRQTTTQNTYFNERFGRSDFSSIQSSMDAIQDAKRYLMKYLEKSGERVVYSKGTPTYFISDILDDDVVCSMNEQKATKLILFDDFQCLDEGCYMGQVSPEVIAQMRKAN